MPEQRAATFVGGALYANDHQDALPPRDLVNGWPGQLRSILPNDQVMLCPNDRDTVKTTAENTPMKGRSSPSYLMNGFSDFFVNIASRGLETLRQRIVGGRDEGEFDPAAVRNGDVRRKRPHPKSSI